MNNKDRNIYKDQMIHPEAIKGNPQTITTYQIKIARSKSGDFDESVTHNLYIGLILIMYKEKVL